VFNPFSFIHTIARFKSLSSKAQGRTLTVIGTIFLLFLVVWGPLLTPSLIGSRRFADTAGTLACIAVLGGLGFASLFTGVSNWKPDRRHKTAGVVLAMLGGLGTCLLTLWTWACLRLVFGYRVGFSEEELLIMLLLQSVLGPGILAVGLLLIRKQKQADALKTAGQEPDRTLGPTAG
jgi:hypothetical protein